MFVTSDIGTSFGHLSSIPVRVQKSIRRKETLYDLTIRQTVYIWLVHESINISKNQKF